MTVTKSSPQIASLALLLALSACSVGPDFMRPDLPALFGYTADALPEQTAQADSPMGGAQHFITARDIPGEWWTLFKSPTLNAYVAEALKNNPTLEMAQASLRRARETLYASEGAFYPSVDAGFSRNRSKSSSAEFGGSSFPINLLYSVYGASVSASYNVDVWGGVRRSVESAGAQQDYQRYEVEAAYLTLTSNVVTTAIQEASLRAQVKATDDIIKVDEESLRILNAQFELGAVSKTSVLTQATTLAQARATLPALHKQLAFTRDALMALMGRSPAQDDGNAFELANLTLPVELPVSLPSSLIDQRPDVRAAEAQLHAATAEIGVTTANLLPQFTISASGGSEALQFGNLFQPGNGIWSLATGVTQPLFHGGTLLHEKRESEAALDEAAAQYKQTVIGAFQNVADALQAIKADAEALQANVEAAKAASESLRIAKLQFDAGTLTYLLLLTSEQQYQQAVVSLAQAEAQRLADTAALFQALGGGWWNRADVPNEDEADYRSRVEMEQMAAHAGPDPLPAVETTSIDIPQATEPQEIQP